MIGKLTMDLLPSFANCECGIVFGIEMLSKNHSLVLFHIGHPRATLLVPAHPFIPRGIVRPHACIHGVFRTSSQPKVSDSVIRGVPVYVVHETLRKLTIGIQPSESVSQIVPLINMEIDANVPSSDGRSCGRSHKPRDTTTSGVKPPTPPSENPGVRVVKEHLHEHRLGKFVSFHRSKVKGQQREVRNRYWPCRDFSRELLA